MIWLRRLWAHLVSPDPVREYQRAKALLAKGVGRHDIAASLEKSPEGTTPESPKSL